MNAVQSHNSLAQEFYVHEKTMSTYTFKILRLASSWQVFKHLCATANLVSMIESIMTFDVLSLK